MRGKTLASFVKLTIFTVITLIVTTILAFTIANIQFRSTHTYHAMFTDATSLLSGDDVRIAGVRVGQVSGVHLADRKYADVTFTVDKDVPLTQGTQAELKFRNLVGQRYLDLVPGPGSGAALKPGGTIPLAQTQPALDLTTLFNGFRPLFQALTPDQVNQLAYEIIQTFQGTGPTVDQLVIHTASLTNALADRDKIIGQVIDNLSSTVATVDANSGGLDELVSQLQRLVTGLAGDREAIRDSLGNIDQLAGNTALLIEQIRPALPVDLTQLSKAADYLANTKNDQGDVFLDEFLGRFPDKLNTIIRTATYGSWFNFYLCDVDGSFTSGGTKITTPTIHNNVPVCNTVYNKEAAGQP
ncbi:MAG TPA: MlaD family protein [Mycobacteriales bacterium]|jgi:phospholipid/cholesterol/gamma-HCH transport system substrate-binding protein|nr:MlaD family protein [Mycobacteriales bacterium]HET7407155.1 MlaD family protein [Mycobacteriales bacterium]